MGGGQTPTRLADVEHTFRDDDRIATHARGGNFAVRHVDLQLDQTRSAHLQALLDDVAMTAAGQFIEAKDDAREGAGISAV